MYNWSVDLKKVGTYILIFLMGLFLVQVISSFHLELARLSQRIQVEKMMVPYLIRSLGCILFGMLVKWRWLLEILKGNLRINSRLIPGVLLAIISLIPQFYYLYISRITVPLLLNIPDTISQGWGPVLRSLFIAPLIQGSIPLVLGVAAGVLIVEGLKQ
ncbi:MAG: hypothetical protein D5R97_06790 [Candidatus Syntrophonatronum acetioxidans]|uniref:Uncharacterized protein n=1 Tax=Candidatus Syntrophonatronum acetioxidans TaxID=1795816 RepID=A0A424YD95_9FIRM|nr:MAG: hypothetical protein D5R97_06790 [Candidatus Syntrophonatronum acetioxidans]